MGRTPQGVRGLKFFYCNQRHGQGLSHPARGAWIEILLDMKDHARSRLSHPARGAWIEIPRRQTARTACARSHPARGAWIEMHAAPFAHGCAVSHPARGAWIEMPPPAKAKNPAAGRTPQGVRGLKFHWDAEQRRNFRRTPQGVRGLKYVVAVVAVVAMQSHPARGAWIEMLMRSCLSWSALVAPRKGCVD